MKPSYEKSPHDAFCDGIETVYREYMLKIQRKLPHFNYYSNRGCKGTSVEWLLLNAATLSSIIRRLFFDAIKTSPSKRYDRMQYELYL
jgi:hypothetical protein